jgi:hypothetical protein
VGAALFSAVPLWPAVLLGAVLGTVVVCFRRLTLAVRRHVQVPAMVAAGLMPVLAAGSLVYPLERLLIW